MFAKPFVGQLGNGHVDGVYQLARDPESLDRFASGSGDGVVKVWDLPSKRELWQTKAHDNIVKGMCWTHDRKLLSCAADKTVALHDPYNTSPGSKPRAIYQSKVAFTGLSHHRSENAFAASTSTGILVYDENRSTSAPIQTLNWPTSVDTISAVAFNPVEDSILASTATDRAVVIYDLRTSSPLHRTVLNLQSNAISWNPMEAMNFAVANEDHNIYLFDMRNMSRALNVLRDHVAAVMDVSFSPTGEELVSASYDRTVRLWNRAKGHSRDIYHTKRMQRVFSATFTQDNNYVISGSDDGNVRLWRARASDRRGVMSAQQRQSLEYQSALKQRYGHMPEIKRIARHRHVPKAVKKAGDIKREELAALKRRDENRRKHEKKTAGKNARKSEREKMVLAQEG